MVLVIAHRGFSAGHPENSLEAFEAAIAAGADAIETDVRLSRDGVPVCSHDADLKRLRGRADTVSQVDVADLEREGILRLDTVLAAVKGRTKVMLDLKLVTEEGLAPGFAVVNKLGMGADVFAGVRDIELVRVVRKLCPAATLLGLIKRPDDLPYFYGAGGAIGRLWEDEATRPSVAAARKDGHKVWVTAGARGAGGVGDIGRDGLKYLYGAGVDGVVVNDPAQAISVRAEMA